MFYNSKFFFKIKNHSRFFYFPVFYIITDKLGFWMTNEGNNNGWRKEDQNIKDDICLLFYVLFFIL